MAAEGEQGGYPSWSSDERRLFVNSIKSGRFEIWAIDLESGQTTPLTRDGGFRAVPSPDGRFIYFGRFDERGIWRIPADGGESEAVLDEPVGLTRWCLWENTIVYLREEEGTMSLEMLDLTSGTETELLPPEAEAPSYISNVWKGCAVSPDGRWILYTRVSASSDLVAIENLP